MELKKLQALSESKFSKLENLTVLDQVLDKKDKNLILDLAHMMLARNYSTTQREDAKEIINKTKMDGDQVLLRLQNVRNFLKDLTNDVKQIEEDVKEVLRSYSI